MTEKQLEVNKNIIEVSEINQLRRKLMLGDVVWVQIKGDSWWPAQVVKDVVSGRKPKRRLEEEILVRLYGSYEHIYMDPKKCQSEFENILRQNNGSCEEIFEKALQQDISQSKSARLKKRVPKSTENGIEEASKIETKRQDGLQKKQKATDTSEKSPGFSPRRMRVMQSLGLIAPSGSPFHRNGLLLRSS